MSEREIFHGHGVLVTTKRLVTPDTTYQLRTITSVRAKPAPSRAPAVILFGLLAVASFAIARGGAVVCGAFGFFFVIATIASLLSAQKAELFITTSARELRAMRGPQKLITETEQALNRAMAEAE